MSRKCKNSPDLFCFVCGGFNPRSSSKKFSPRLLVAYRSYLGFGAEESLSKPWSPSFLCSRCSRYLAGWPAIWREQQNHVNDCYFCLTNITGIKSTSKNNRKYPDVSSMSKPATLRTPTTSTSNEPSTFRGSCGFESSVDVYASDHTDFNDDDYEPPPTRSTTEPHLITQSELNDLIRDLDLPKEKSELLAFRLKQ